MRPMVISVPLLTPAEAWTGDSRWWSRFIVLCADERDGGLFARGICDTGIEMTVRVRREVLVSAQRISLVEVRGTR